MLIEIDEARFDSVLLYSIENEFSTDCSENEEEKTTGKQILRMHLILSFNLHMFVSVFDFILVSKPNVCICVR